MRAANTSHAARERALAAIYRRLYLRGKAAEQRARQERQRAEEYENEDGHQA